VHGLTGWRYRIAKEGWGLKKAFGKSAIGQFLDETLPTSVWPAAQPNFDKCVEARMPVYATFGAIERLHHRVIYERLLLPLGSGSGVVTSIVSSLKSTCWTDESAVSAGPQQIIPEYAFRALIAWPTCSSVCD
jgi:hypothetical protein